MWVVLYRQKVSGSSLFSNSRTCSVPLIILPEMLIFIPVRHSVIVFIPFLSSLLFGKDTGSSFFTHQLTYTIITHWWSEKKYLLFWLRVSPLFKWGRECVVIWDKSLLDPSLGTTLGDLLTGNDLKLCEMTQGTSS